MTRPQIIRADTIDLQDKSSPTAQDHSNQPEHPAPLGIGPAAPHQQASLRSVEDERSAEEARLQHAWNNAGTSLSEDPGSDDERTTVINSNGQKQHQNGPDNDDDMQDADVEEDMDDDMLDKISSSPSIDDGGYSLPSSSLVWPTRRDSLTPNSSPVIPSSASSSPFTTTPVHFPIPVAIPGRLLNVPEDGTDDILFASQHSFTTAPIFQFSQNSSTSQSMEHHRGEYTWTRTTNGTRIDTMTMHDSQSSPRTRELILVEQRLQNMRDDSQGSLMSELDEEHARKMLQSVQPPSMGLPDDPDDPFFETIAPSLWDTDGTPPPRHLDDEGDSWTTDSDADSLDDKLEDDDASNDVSFSDYPRFVDSGWGGECLRETEDIDFEFVYALHTFVATVEGQANATKGDTMVLLDDSNSYWWLVRVVKDSSIGYLPAEHIETPTERLARLNKHRNIDLSATMLGDTAEKTKNPLKKAMRRRNAKTVQFGAPTYVEASDYDYSSDEEGGELFGGPEPKQAQEQQQQAAQKPETEQEESLEVQPLKLGGIKKVSSEESRSSSEEAGKDDDKSRASDEMFDRPLDQKVSRNGTLRNTDSFFKDENTETRKITLTPNLLRDDSSTSTTGSRERGPSLESLEKNGFADKVKDDKKKKDKKSGMLSGLFKRKDKKEKDSKSDIDIVEVDLKKTVEKPEQISPQTVNAKPVETSPERQTEEQIGQAPSRQSSKGKLQKQHRARTDSPIKTKSILKTDSPMEASVNPEDDVGVNELGTAGQQTSSSMRVVSPDQGGALERQTSVEERVKSPENRVKSPESQGVMAAISSKNPFRSNTTTDSAPKPEKVRKAKERVALDDFDSSADESDDPFADPDAQDKTKEQTASEPVGRLSESPVHVSAADAQPVAKEAAVMKDQEPDAQHPPGLTGDNSSADTSSRVSTPDSDAASPDTITPAKLTVAAPRSGVSPSPTHLSPGTNVIPPPSRAAPSPLNVNTSPTVSSAPVSSESTSLPAWSDASLRNYLEDGSEIRDLLLMINDTTGVVPVSKDHPLMSGLYVEETKAAQSLSSELDRLLAGLMDNRMKRHGSGASKKSQLSQMSRASTAGGR